MNAPLDPGLHFVLGLQPSPDITEHDRRLLAALRPAGIVLFRPNFASDLPYADWIERLARLLADCRDYSGRDRLIVAIDHEGGRVHRPPPPITRFPPPRLWPHAARAVGRCMGIELASLGINLDFAPSADIDSNPANPVIGDRSFDASSTVVERAALDMWQGLADAGIKGCMKHFPGHGDTAVDSHLALPRLDHSLELLLARELAPFRSLVAAGVDVAMTAHILFPALDPVLPATVSPRIVGGLLRDAGFDGVVFTDDVLMKAVAERFSRGDGAVEAIAAGCDIVLPCAFSGDTASALHMRDRIVAAAAADDDFASQCAASQHRIHRLIGKLSQTVPHCLDAATLADHANLAQQLRGQG